MADESTTSRWVLQKGTTTMFIAEVVGTGILLFIGCMGSIGSMGAGPPPQLQSSIAFGMTVNVLIMMLGHVSGAHLNPAVTIGAVIVGIKTIPTGILYALAQFLGATLGYGILMMITPPELFHAGNPNSTIGLCVTVVHEGVGTAQAILIEILCTAVILCTACATWDPRCSNMGDSMALKFGFAVVGISCAASPYTGCSMNPARTFAPALFHGYWKNQWIYWIGPTFGALLGTYTYQLLFALKKEEYTEVVHDKHDFTEMKTINVLEPVALESDEHPDSSRNGMPNRRLQLVYKVAS
ncbi:aquaporin AQPAe.a [Nomia melanderi]|uniref:aquaporin AQPAe.a n=1 Tax=Nomia melanderi TaxID=2448451 RepID=UPI0013045D2C|nr:aquaporin AQPAe.a-like [Nomia melanderi]